MLATRKIAALAAVLALASASGGCTLVKPVVGAVTGPVYGVQIFADGVCGCDDAHFWCAYLLVTSTIGAAAGLVTGVISDFEALTGRADDPMRNWWIPFETNTSGSGW